MSLTRALFEGEVSSKSASKIGRSSARKMTFGGASVQDAVEGAASVKADPSQGPETLLGTTKDPKADRDVMFLLK